MKKRKKGNEVPIDVRESCKRYANMLLDLMIVIQDYLLLSDDNQHEATKSLQLVHSTARKRADNRICIWLEELPLQESSV